MGSAKAAADVVHTAQSTSTSPPLSPLVLTRARPNGTVVDTLNPRDEGAVAIRPGEHACCRLAHAADRQRLARDFIRDGLRRGHKVVYLHDEDVTDFVSHLAAIDDSMQPAVARGQLDVRSAHTTYTPDGRFDVERMLSTTDSELERALAEGYTGLSLTGEMTWALGDPGAAELLGVYERRLAEGEYDGKLVFLCQYDHGRFPAGTLSTVGAAHDVDVPPELAPIGREGVLAAGMVHATDTLRLAGELDYGCSDTVAEVLGTHFHGDLRLDLADLSYVDVAGMRALRGRTGQSLTIAGASESVRRLMGLLSWDTDPVVDVVSA